MAGGCAAPPPPPRPAAHPPVHLPSCQGACARRPLALTPPAPRCPTPRLPSNAGSAPMRSRPAAAASPGAATAGARPRRDRAPPCRRRRRRCPAALFTVARAPPASSPTPPPHPAPPRPPAPRRSKCGDTCPGVNYSSQSMKDYATCGQCAKCADCAVGCSSASKFKACSFCKVRGSREGAGGGRARERLWRPSDFPPAASNLLARCLDLPAALRIVYIVPTAASEPPQLLRPAAARTRRAHGALAARHKKRPQKTQPSALHRPASLARPAEHVDCARSHASQGRAPPGCVPSKESPRPEGQKVRRPPTARPHIRRL
jgi:hypothetical protein